MQKAQTRDITISSVIAAVMLILTALGSAEVLLAASAIMIVSLLLLQAFIDRSALWPKIAICVCAAALAVGAVLLIR